MKRKKNILLICLLVMTALSACGTEGTEEKEEVSEDINVEEAETEGAKTPEEPDAASDEEEKEDAGASTIVVSDSDLLSADGDSSEPADTEEVEEIVEDMEAVETDTADNNGVLECDVVPCGAYDLDETRYVVVGTYDDDDSGECMLTFVREDGGYYTDGYYYDIENIEGDTYSATNWSENISVMIIFSDGGMELSGGTGELEEYNGHYTLR